MSDRLSFVLSKMQEPFLTNLRKELASIKEYLGKVECMAVSYGDDGIYENHVRLAERPDDALMLKMLKYMIRNVGDVYWKNFSGEIELEDINSFCLSFKDKKESILTIWKAKKHVDNLLYQLERMQKYADRPEIKRIIFKSLILYTEE